MAQRATAALVIVAAVYERSSPFKHIWPITTNSLINAISDLNGIHSNWYSVKYARISFTTPQPTETSAWSLILNDLFIGISYEFHLIWIRSKQLYIICGNLWGKFNSDYQNFNQDMSSKVKFGTTRNPLDQGCSLRWLRSTGRLQR